VEQPFCSFTKASGNKDGYDNQCRECEKEWKRKYREKNRELLAEKERERRRKKFGGNPQPRKNKPFNNAEYMRERRRNSDTFRLSSNLRTRMTLAIKTQYGFKSGSSNELLGCSFEEVRQHLEEQFTEGMSWDNHGKNGWHIDHIRPCASFDLNDPEQQKECFHYTNLQPLWAEDNLKKGDRIL
jgi:hypothetical protein